MILTCPECATAYFVDESKIPPEGRMVKCAACGARWMAHPAPADEAGEPEAPAEAHPAESDLALEGTPEAN